GDTVVVQRGSPAASTASSRYKPASDSELPKAAILIERSSGRPTCASVIPSDPPPRSVVSVTTWAGAVASSVIPPPTGILHAHIPTIRTASSAAPQAGENPAMGVVEGRTRVHTPLRAGEVATAVGFAKFCAS